MKKLLLITCLLLACSLAFGQNKDKKLKSKKLSKEDAANLTPEQRLIHEEDRKSKGGKKKISAAKKAKIQRKQSRAAKHIRTPENGPRPKPKD